MVTSMAIVQPTTAIMRIGVPIGERRLDKLRSVQAASRDREAAADSDSTGENVNRTYRLKMALPKPKRPSPAIDGAAKTAEETGTAASRTGWKR